MMRVYSFDDAWHVDGTYDDVFTVLEHLERYPRWWPDVELVTRIDPDTALVTIRSVLPYRLRFRLERRRVDRAAGVLEAGMDGDLVGTTRWLVRPHRDGTAVRLVEWARLGRPSLAVLESVLAPAYVANHAWMVRRGRRGLSAEVGRAGDGRTSGLGGRRARVPPWRTS